jgi:hypothetical protein
LTGLECRYPTPLSTGGGRITRDVTLLYAINGDEISVSSQEVKAILASNYVLRCLTPAGARLRGAMTRCLDQRKSNCERSR